MMYAGLKDCLIDLEKEGQLIRVKEPVDARFEMAAIHLHISAAGGPAILFEKIKDCRFPAVSNVFGTTERCRFLFRGTQKKIDRFFRFPVSSLPVLKRQMQHLPAIWNTVKASPQKSTFKGFREIRLNELPHILHWPEDSGASISFPQIFIKPPDNHIAQAKLFHNPVLLSGDELQPDEEAGIFPVDNYNAAAFHAGRLQRNSKISIFVGGAPSHCVAAANLLPEFLHPLVFAGVLGERRFRYSYDSDGFFISNDADFVLTGKWQQKEEIRSLEGVLGNESGYYATGSTGLVLKVHKVYARPDAIWQFTVPYRGNQEKSVLQSYIFSWLSDFIKRDIPGLKDFRNVEAAGGRRLLLATVHMPSVNDILSPKPFSGLMAIANRILGNRYLANTQYLWIIDAENGQRQPSVSDAEGFLKFALERADWQSDIYFQTEQKEVANLFNNQKDNQGSVVFTIRGQAKRALGTEIPGFFWELQYFDNPLLAMPGIVVLQAPAFESYEKAGLEMEALSDMLTVRSEDDSLQQFPLIVIADDTEKMTRDYNDFLWGAFTKCAPLTDIYGVDSFFENKHWGCKSSLIMDARDKPHHQMELKMPDEVLEGLTPLFDKGGSLYRFR